MSNDRYELPAWWWIRHTLGGCCFVTSALFVVASMQVPLVSWGFLMFALLGAGCFFTSIVLQSALWRRYEGAHTAHPGTES